MKTIALTSIAADVRGGCYNKTTGHYYFNDSQNVYECTFDGTTFTKIKTTSVAALGTTFRDISTGTDRIILYKYVGTTATYYALRLSDLSVIGTASNSSMSSYDYGTFVCAYNDLILVSGYCTAGASVYLISDDGTVVQQTSMPVISGISSGPHSMSIDESTGEMFGMYYYSSSDYLARANMALGVGAQTLLAAPVTKTPTNTMKIQYDFNVQKVL